jgi:septal ring factor EnvC (AmiA/AmiB activator)
MITLNKLYLFLALCLVVVGCVWYFEHRGAEKEREKQRAAEIAAFQLSVEKSAKIAQDLEAQLTTMREANLQLSNKLNEERQRNPIYKACVVPATGIELLKQAAEGGS